MDFFWIVFGTGYIIHVLCKEKFGAGPLTILLGLLIRDDPKKVPHWNMPNEKIPRWTEDEFVEHCTTPLFPAKIIDNNDTEALYNLGLSAGETVEHLVEHHSDFRNMSHSYRFFEVYKKNDGTFYAWPCRASLNRILKGNMNCYQGTYIREQKGYGIPYSREEYYETSVDLLRFYFEMPELTFVDK